MELTYLLTYLLTYKNSSAEYTRILIFVDFIVFGTIITSRSRPKIIRFITARPLCSQCRALYQLEGFCPSVCLSVRPSVRPSVTFRYCVQTNEDTIVRFSASGRRISLVSGEVKFIRIFEGITPSGGVKVRHPLSIAKIRPIIGHNLETAQDRR